MPPGKRANPSRLYMFVALLLAPLRAGDGVALAEPGKTGEPERKSCKGHDAPSEHPYDAIQGVKKNCETEAEKEQKVASVILEVRRKIQKDLEGVTDAAKKAPAQPGGNDQLNAATSLLQAGITELKTNAAKIQEAQKAVSPIWDVANASASKLIEARGKVNDELLKLREERRKLGESTSQITGALPKRLELQRRNLEQQRPDPNLDRTIAQMQKQLETEQARAKVLDETELPKFDKAVKAHEAAIADHKEIEKGLQLSKVVLDAEAARLNSSIEKANGMLEEIKKTGKGLATVPDLADPSQLKAVQTAPNLTAEEKKELDRYKDKAAFRAGMASGDGTLVSPAEGSKLDGADRLKYAATDSLLEKQQKLEKDLDEAGGAEGVAARTKAGVEKLKSYQDAIVNPDNEEARKQASADYNAFMNSECKNAAVCAEYMRLGVKREINDGTFHDEKIIQTDAMGAVTGTETTGRRLISGNSDPLGLKGAGASTAAPDYVQRVEEAAISNQRKLNDGYSSVVSAALEAKEKIEYANSPQHAALEQAARNVSLYDSGGVAAPIESADDLRKRAVAPVVNANPYAAGLVTAEDPASKNFILAGVAGANKDNTDRNSLIMAASPVPVLGSGMAYGEAKEDAARSEMSALQSGNQAELVEEARDRRFQQKVAGAMVAADVVMITPGAPELMMAPVKGAGSLLSDGGRITMSAASESAVKSAALESVEGDVIRAGSRDVADAAASVSAVRAIPIAEEPRVAAFSSAASRDEIVAAATHVESPPAQAVARVEEAEAAPVNRSSLVAEQLRSHSGASEVAHATPAEPVRDLPVVHAPEPVRAAEPARAPDPVRVAEAPANEVPTVRAPEPVTAPQPTRAPDPIRVTEVPPTVYEAPAVRAPEPRVIEEAAPRSRSSYAAEQLQSHSGASEVAHVRPVEPVRELPATRAPEPVRTVEPAHAPDPIRVTEAPPTVYEAPTVRAPEPVRVAEAPSPARDYSIAWDTPPSPAYRAAEAEPVAGRSAAPTYRAPEPARAPEPVRLTENRAPSSVSGPLRVESAPVREAASEVHVAPVSRPATQEASAASRSPAEGASSRATPESAAESASRRLALVAPRVGVERPSVLAQTTGRVQDFGAAVRSPLKTIVQSFKSLFARSNTEIAAADVLMYPGGTAYHAAAQDLRSGVKEDMRFTRWSRTEASTAADHKVNSALANTSMTNRIRRYDTEKEIFLAKNGHSADVQAAVKKFEKSLDQELIGIDARNARLGGTKPIVSDDLPTGFFGRFSRETEEVDGRIFSSQAVEYERKLPAIKTEDDLRRQAEELLNLRTSDATRRIDENTALRLEAYEYRNATRPEPLIANDVDGRLFQDGAKRFVAKDPTFDRASWLKAVGGTRHPLADDFFFEATRAPEGLTAAEKILLRDITANRGIGVDESFYRADLEAELRRMLSPRERGYKSLTSYQKYELRSMSEESFEALLRDPRTRTTASEGFMGRRPEFVANYVVSSDPEVAHKAVMALGTTENEYALDALRLVVRDGPDGLARNSAIAQLGASGNPETLHFLRMEMRETDVPELFGAIDIFDIKAGKRGSTEFTPKMPVRYGALSDEEFVAKMLASDPKTVAKMLDPELQRLDRSSALKGHQLPDQDFYHRPASVRYAMFQHDSPEVRRAAARSLSGDVSNPEAWIRLAIADPVREVKIEALDTIASGRMNAIDQKLILRSMAESDPDPLVRAAAYQKLTTTSETEIRYFEAPGLANERRISDLRGNRETGTISPAAACGRRSRITPGRRFAKRCIRRACSRAPKRASRGPTIGSGMRRVR